MKKLIIGVVSLLAISGAQAKDVMLQVKNPSVYPINIHYKFIDGNLLFGEGHIKHMNINEKHYISVNRIPDNKEVTVQIDKISFGDGTVINAPCEIRLKKNQSKAYIDVGFKGDWKTRGSFFCNVSPYGTS